MDSTLLFDSASFPLSISRMTCSAGEVAELSPSARASFFYIEEGDVGFSFAQTTVPVTEAQGLYVNPQRRRRLHSYAPSRLVLFEFDQSLVGTSTLASEKYIQPLFHSASDFAVLSRSACLGLVKALQALEDSPFGYELKMLSGLFDVLSLLAYEKEDVLKRKENLSDERLCRMLSFMQEHLDEKLDVGAIAEAGFVSVREASRLFARHLSTSPMKYFLTLRLEEARRQLEKGDETITEICQSTGFESVSHFSTCFRKMYAMSPSAYRSRFS